MERRAVDPAGPMVLLCRMLVLSTPLPPPDLMLLVTGNADSTQWAASRRLAVEDIQGQLKALDIQLGRDAEILDLGCGCGRLLAGWEGLLPDTAILHGVDINPQLVAFCQDNIPFASVSCCNYDPPLGFDRAKFDLVYCASVFTHMTLPACLRWAAELARVVKPGGTLMISYHGEYYIDTLRGLAADGEKRLRRDGYYMFLHGEEEQTFLGSNYYASFMTTDFVSALFNGFALLHLHQPIKDGTTYFTAGQDIAIFRRPKD